MRGDGGTHRRARPSWWTEGMPEGTKMCASTPDTAHDEAGFKKKMGLEGTGDFISAAWLQTTRMHRKTSTQTHTHTHKWRHKHEDRERQRQTQT